MCELLGLQGIDPVYRAEGGGRLNKAHSGHLGPMWVVVGLVFAAYPHLAQVLFVGIIRSLIPANHPNFARRIGWSGLCRESRAADVEQPACV